MSIRIAVLVSVARHPVSGRAMATPTDAAALEIALNLGADSLHVIHAGDPDNRGLRDYLGMGLDALHVLRLGVGIDALDALAWHLQSLKPQLILTGSRGGSGRGSGMLPYAIAARLGLPIATNARAVGLSGDAVTIDQALPFGCVRRLRLAGPAVAAVHSAAPAARFATFAAMRSGRIMPVDPPAELVQAADQPQFQPAKRRPMPLDPVRGAHYTERLERIMGGVAADGNRVIKAEPAAAAQLIIEMLAGAGVGAFANAPHKASER